MMTKTKYSIEVTDFGAIIRGQISAQDLVGLLTGWYSDEEDSQAMVDNDLAKLLDASFVVVNSPADGAKWFDQARKAQLSAIPK